MIGKGEEVEGKGGFLEEIERMVSGYCCIRWKRCLQGAAVLPLIKLNLLRITTPWCP